VGVTGTYRMFRWQNTIGWLQATDGGSGFTNGTNGSNYAEATNINAFSDWTIGVSEKPLVIDTLEIGKTIEVYPNPNNGTFSISVGKNKLDSPAYLLNAQGTVVATPVATGQNSEATKFTTTGLPAGVYFLYTTVAGKTKITKIVIQ
ncbi:MAG: T9SS C-terminal target domain-containing protein, partial [Bacteroidetes bacterium]